MTAAADIPAAPRVATGLRDTVRAARLPVLTLLYLFCVLVPVRFQAGPLTMTSLRLLLLAVTVPLLVNLLSGRYGRPIATDFLMLGHIVWAALALSVNNPDRVVEQAGSVGIEFVGGYLIGRATIRTRADFAALCRLLVWGVLVTTPFALLESQTGRPYIVEAIRAVPGLTSVPAVHIEGRLGMERAQATFAHPIHYGLFCSVALSLTFVGLRNLMSDARRWVSTLLILLSGLLALSSGALIAMALQVSLIAWQMGLSGVRARWWGLLGLCSVGYVVVDLLSDRTPIEVFMSHATFSAHNAYWRSIIFDWGVDNVLGSAERNIPASPWFGIGMNDWIRPHYMYSGSMDNFWLVMAVRYGLPGLGLLAAGYLLGLGRVMRRDFAGDPVLAQFRRAWVFTFVGLTFTLCTVHIWTSVYSFVFFVFGAGMWFLSARPVDGAPEAGAPGDVSPGSAATPAAGPRLARVTRFPSGGSPVTPTRARAAMADRPPRREDGTPRPRLRFARKED